MGIVFSCGIIFIPFIAPAQNTNDTIYKSLRLNLMVGFGTRFNQPNPVIGHWAGIIVVEPRYTVDRYVAAGIHWYYTEAYTNEKAYADAYGNSFQLTSTFTWNKAKRLQLYAGSGAGICFYQFYSINGQKKNFSFMPYAGIETGRFRSEIFYSNNGSSLLNFFGLGLGAYLFGGRHKSL